MKGHLVVLKDGSAVLIRPIAAGDGPLLAEGFARLSPESRRLRFLTGKSKLTTAELRYFTRIDHHDHEALGALDPVDGRGVGIARYIRTKADPEGAEVAVTVIDEWQGRGLATELLHRLTDRARQEGIRHFSAMVSVENSAVAGLLDEVPGGVQVAHREGGTVEYEITLPPRGIGDQLYALLRAFARRQFQALAPILDAPRNLTRDELPGVDEDQGPTSTELAEPR